MLESCAFGAERAEMMRSSDREVGRLGQSSQTERPICSLVKKSPCAINSRWRSNWIAAFLRAAMARARSKRLKRQWLGGGCGPEGNLHCPANAGIIDPLRTPDKPIKPSFLIEVMYCNDSTDVGKAASIMRLQGVFEAGRSDFRARSSRTGAENQQWHRLPRKTRARDLLHQGSGDAQCRRPSPQ